MTSMHFAVQLKNTVHGGPLTRESGDALSPVPRGGVEQWVWRSVPVPGLVWDSSGRTRRHRLGPRPASSGAAIAHCYGVSQD